MGDKGDPTITVEQLPAPSARKPKKKSPKTLNLFSIRPRKKDEHDEGGKKAGGSRTLYYIGKRPAQPKPKRAEWRQRGQDTPDWVRPWLDAPVSKGVFLTPNPFLVAPKHGVFGHVYAYEVPHWVIKQAKGIHRKDEASEVLIPEPLWEHVKLKGKSMDQNDFLNQVYMSEDAAFTDSRANKYRTKSDWEASRLAAPKKYEHIDFVPPKGVASAAAKGLELRQKASPSNKGGLTPAEASKEGIGSGVQRAVNLKNRDPVSPKVIKQIRGFLSRSEKSSEISAENRGTPWNDKGYVAWLLWGGDPAKAWVAKIIKQMDAADEKALKTAAVRFAASKALSKKEVPKADGSGTTTIYEYGPRQVAQRNKAKAVRIEALRQKITDLRKQVHADLTAEDSDTRLTALAVSLIDETYARVGNEKSAKAGHHGVTNWQTDHVTLADKSATIRYTGKSGVEQAKRVTNARVLAALRKALEGKSKGDKVLCDGDECSILAKDVNTYLKPFEITAKDIRGLHANEEMKHHLKEQRKAGPDLPRARKDKDKILKAEFKAALELASAAVGHKDSTLRSQYLVPSMEASYTHDGTVLDRLDKKATLSDSEKEERESARLVRQSPKLKPPRKDKERGRVKDTDPNTDPDEAQDQKDRSRNYKDASARVALRYLLAVATATNPAPQEREKRKVGDTWEGKDGKWSAKGKDGIEPGFASQEAAKTWLKGVPKPGADSAPAAEGGSPAEAPTPKPPAKKGPLTRSQKRKMVETLSEGLAQGAGTTLGKLPESVLRAVAEELGEPAKAVVDAMIGETASLEERAAFAKATLKRIPSGKNPSPKEIADALVAIRAAEVRKDPLLLDLSNPLTGKSTEALNLEGAAQKEFMDKMGNLTVSTTDEYREMPKSDRDAHRKGLGEHLDKLEKDGHTDTEQFHSTLAQIRGLQMASALEDGDAAEGINPAFQTFLKAADSQGGDVLDKFIKLNVTGATEGDAGAQQQFRDVLREVEPEVLAGMVEKDHPARGVLERLNGSHLDDGTNAGRRKQEVWNKYMDGETAQLLQEHAEDMIMEEILFTDMGMVREGKTTGEMKNKKPSKKTTARRKKQTRKTESLLELLRKKWEEAQKAAKGTFTSEEASPAPKKTASHTLSEVYDFAPWGALCPS